MGDQDQSGKSGAKGLYIAGAVVVIAAIGAFVFMSGGPGSDQTGPQVSKEDAAQTPEPAAPAPVPVTANIQDGVYTNAQARRGDAVYAEHCALCHLPSMTGKEPAPELAGDLFMSKWEGMSVGDLFIRITSTMPVSNPGILSEEQYTELVALLLQANNFPAGKEDLKSDQDFMDGIRILTN